MDTQLESTTSDGDPLRTQFREAIDLLQRISDMDTQRRGPGAQSHQEDRQAEHRSQSTRSARVARRIDIASLTSDSAAIQSLEAVQDSDFQALSQSGIVQQSTIPSTSHARTTSRATRSSNQASSNVPQSQPTSAISSLPTALIQISAQPSHPRSSNSSNALSATQARPQRVYRTGSEILWRGYACPR
ncbi:hypothetical protein BDZ97DRAFT_1914284 [Flammula alnicola]|nr:hypothetical protein BDZ97DRAFT_1914284 [Flammula alnicola]